jgi:hypothetical protein
MSANILDLFASNVTATANGNGSWKDTAEIVDYDVPVLFLFFNLKFAAAGAEGGNYDLYWKPAVQPQATPGCWWPNTTHSMRMSLSCPSAGCLRASSSALSRGPG